MMITNRFMLIVACSLLFFVFLTGCTTEEEKTKEQQTQKQKQLAPPDQSPDLSAEVESQNGNKIIVVDRISDDQNGDVTTVQVELNVEPSTLLLIREGENQYRQGKLEDLQKGTKVEVWYKNIVLDGDPLIANGEYIVYEKP